MKKVTISLLLMFVLTLSNIVSAEPKTITLSLPTMNCAMCPITVRKALEQVKGVNDVEVSYASKQAVVQYDDDTTNIQNLIQATTQAGYPSQQVKR